MSPCLCRQNVRFASSSSNDLRLESAFKNPSEPCCSRRKLLGQPASWSNHLIKSGATFKDCLPSASSNRQRVKEEARELKTNRQFGVPCRRRCCRRHRIFLLPGSTDSRNARLQWCMDRKPIGLGTLPPVFPGVYFDCLTAGGLPHLSSREGLRRRWFLLHTTHTAQPEIHLLNSRAVGCRSIRFSIPRSLLLLISLLKGLL